MEGSFVARRLRTPGVVALVARLVEPLAAIGQISPAQVQSTFECGAVGLFKRLLLLHLPLRLKGYCCGSVWLRERGLEKENFEFVSISVRAHRN